MLFITVFKLCSSFGEEKWRKGERERLETGILGGEIAWVKWSQIFMGQQKKHGDMVGFKIHVYTYYT